MNHDKAVERFEALVSQYGHVIRAAVRSVAGRDAEGLGQDAEQQVLLELWKQILREQEITYPSSYLYRAAVRETIRLARRAKRRSEEELLADQLTDSRPASQPERQAERRELSERLRQATAGLIENRRTAVTAHLAGYRVQEIMESNGWTYNRARNLTVRGMADLRRALEEDDAT